MFKIGIRYFFERLMINYFNKRSENLEEHDVYWKVTSFYNKKPDYGLKIGLFGKSRNVSKTWTFKIRRS